jgi:hypothetical protein
MPRSPMTRPWNVAAVMLLQLLQLTTAVLPVFGREAEVDIGIGVCVL